MIPPAITKIVDQIDSRVMRERVLIFLTLLALVFFVWNFLMQAKIDRKSKDLKMQSDQIAVEQRALEAKIATLTMELAADPAIQKTNELRSINANISEVEQQLSGLSQGLIGAEQLPKVLEEMLQRTTSVKLLQVRTLAATELQLESEKVGSKENIKSELVGAGVYKHGVLIKVVGNYSQLIQLMAEIEALNWKFYWESLDYTVTRYPNAEIDIRVFTLSSEEGLLGV